LTRSGTGEGVPAGRRLQGPGEQLCSHRRAAAQLPVTGWAGASLAMERQRRATALSVASVPRARKVSGRQAAWWSRPRKTHVRGQRRPRREEQGINIYFFNGEAGSRRCIGLHRPRRKPAYVLRRAFQFEKSPHYILNFCESLFFLHEL
jgi:hypothetical protein